MVCLEKGGWSGALAPGEKATVQPRGPQFKAPALRPKPVVVSQCCNQGYGVGVETGESLGLAGHSAWLHVQ